MTISSMQHRSNNNHESDMLASSYIDAIISLEEIDVDLFRGETPFTGMNERSVYGGQLVAQAIAAATRTAPENFYVHSVHSNFVRPGQNSSSLFLYVKRLRDGKDFATRYVRIAQQGKSIFYMTASLQRGDCSGLSHQIRMPSVPQPLSVPSDTEHFETLSRDMRLSERDRNICAQKSHKSFPIEIRRINPINPFTDASRHTTITNNNNDNNHSNYLWMKSRNTLPDTFIAHQCMAAYGSDSAAIGTMLRPHDILFSHKHLRSASLDHSMWFHVCDFRADDWMLLTLKSPRTSCSRGLVFGHIYDRTGRLIVSMSQEGLIQLQPNL